MDLLELDKMQSSIHRFTAMGSPCVVAVGAPWHTWLKSAEMEVRRIESKYSRFCQQSYLVHLNKRAKTQRVEVDSETTSLLNYAEQCYIHSDGIFDITSGSLSELWRLSPGSLPQSEEVKCALIGVGWPKVGFDGESIAFANAEVALDFGGVAKEYAVDRVVSSLLNTGVEYGWVNLGGDMRVFGGVLPVGVRTPVSGEKQAVATYDLSSAMATSGDYERCRWIDGIRYSHLLDPRTGWPVRGGLTSVSVVANECMVAGSVSSVGVLKSSSDGLEWLSSLGLDYLALKQDGGVAGTLCTRPS